MSMTSKERLITAFEGGVPDRLPVTTHHVMPYFLNKYMDGISNLEFFDHFGLDAIIWPWDHRPDESKGEYADPDQEKIGFLQSRRVSTDNWRVEHEDIPGEEVKTTRYRFITPKRTLAMVLQGNEQTTWVAEYLIKRKEDVDIIGEYMTHPKCDVEAVNRQADEFGDRGIVRGLICPFDVFGQAGTWQDAACLVHIEDLILATYDDPKWVHELLGILGRRKATYIESLKGAQYDIIEHGGGAASSTVISPQIFDDFVIPYDKPLVDLAHQVGHRVVYHTCGGMMSILENIGSMNPDALETFTPSGMGGDTDLAEAKKRIGDQVCMIGGFDQFHYFSGCTPEETRAAVRKCFDEAGGGGGFVLAPSDHFFDADPELIMAFATEAQKCIY
ncbi:MAG: hypothetical protein GTO55_07150 [Armatimonadetes bacterium]|nr:hypothetical protein [Armatimonadota bacterium]NIM24047.1 hypothetical protein [Armatimonadota bacterium]NIM67901.1 hypothetical protein [Armatimonadota bacterium]NIM76423.1 hypothetical protein [Armatimonadota bacterium]NIN06131.1 hypothetical protein [Armatimonadota bacterium]